MVKTPALTPENGLELAKKKAGGDIALGNIVGLSRQAIWKWHKIPPERVPAISEATGIARYKLRPDLPDLFPHPTTA